MEKVVLFYQESPDIRISMELYFTEKGQLFFDGCDSGKKVDETWGDSDYEYTYTIEPDAVNQLYNYFDLEPDDTSGLLKVLKEEFSGINAYRLFGEFLKARNIRYEGFSWT